MLEVVKPAPVQLEGSGADPWDTLSLKRLCPLQGSFSKQPPGPAWSLLSSTPRGPVWGLLSPQVALHGGFSLTQGPPILAPSPFPQGLCGGLLSPWGGGSHMETHPRQEFLGTDVYRRVQRPSCSSVTREG